MIYSAAAGHAPCHIYVIGLDPFYIALAPGILIAADHDRFIVLPEIEIGFAAVRSVKEELFQREILRGIKAV